MGLGVLIVFTLTAVMLISYFYGRHVNYSLQRGYWKVLSGVVKSYSKKVSYRSLGSSMFQVSFPCNPPLKRVEITVLLMDREFLTHYIASRLMGRSDEFILKASFSKDPDFTFQIGGKAKGMDRLEPGWVGFEVYTDNKARAIRLLGDNEFRRTIRRLKGRINLLVIGEGVPNILVRCKAESEVARLMLRLAERASHLVASKV